MSLVIIILGIFLWFMGYYYTTHKMSNTDQIRFESEKIIVSPPTWLYYLCGAPMSNKYPKGTMRVLALRVQFFGLAIVIYAIWHTIWKPSYYENFIGYVLSFIITLIITGYVSWRYTFRERKKGANKRGKI